MRKDFYAKTGDVIQFNGEELEIKVAHIEREMVVLATPLGNKVLHPNLRYYRSGLGLVVEYCVPIRFKKGYAHFYLKVGDAYDWCVIERGNRQFALFYGMSENSLLSEEEAAESL